MQHNAANNQRKRPGSADPPLAGWLLSVGQSEPPSSGQEKLSVMREPLQSK